ncbi:MAG: O-antigen ligase family protein, partial [Candidatus Marinimicrobia bacterium]|nr:O-antigen ligase family protein [Candidatus Neomarinimicrobiota bacterium]
LFFLYLILFPFGVLAQLPLNLWGLPEIRIYLVDLILALLLISWGMWRFLLKRKPYQLPPLALPLFSFSVLALLSLGAATPLLSNREVIVASLYLVRWLVYVGFYLVLFDLRKTLFKKRNPLHLLMVLGIMVALFGFVQYFFYPNLKALEVLYWDPHFYRLASTFLDPNFTGLILVLTLIILINLLLENKKNKKLWLAGAMTYLALLLTHSRSSYLAFLVGVGFLAFFKRKYLLFLIALGLLAFSLIILPQPRGEGGKLTRTYTIVGRIENWQKTLTIAQDHLLLGVGFNTYRYAQREYGFLEEGDWQESYAGAGADSSLLFVLATTGLLGLASYLWFLISAGALAFKHRKKIMGVVCLASLGAIFIHAFFLNSLFYPWVMGWLMILLASL